MRLANTYQRRVLQHAELHEFFIILLKYNWFLIIELNPFSWPAKDSKTLSLARNFLLMLSLIYFWPYTRSLNVGWKLKLLPCCGPKERLGLEFHSCWGWYPKLLGVIVYNKIHILFGQRASVAQVSNIATSLTCDPRLHNLIHPLVRRFQLFY